MDSAIVDVVEAGSGGGRRRGRTSGWHASRSLTDHRCGPGAPDDGGGRRGYTARPARPAAARAGGVWAAHETGLVDGAFDHASITTQGATVGAPMLSNMLSRMQRPFDLVLGRITDPAGHRARPGGAAHRRRGVRHPASTTGAHPAAPSRAISTVDVPDDELHAGYGHRGSLRRARRSRRCLAGPSSPARTAGAGRRSPSELGIRRRVSDRGRGSLDRSLRAAPGARGLVAAATRSTAGRSTVTCPSSGSAIEIGIAPCWALGRLTTMGKPFNVHRRHPDCQWPCWSRSGSAEPRCIHEIEAIGLCDRELVIAQQRRAHLPWARPRGAAATQTQWLVLRHRPALRVWRRPRADAGTRDAGGLPRPTRMPWWLPAGGRSG